MNHVLAYIDFSDVLKTRKPYDAELRRAAQRRFYWRNRERRIEQSRELKKLNGDKYLYNRKLKVAASPKLYQRELEYARKYYQKHRERIIARVTAWKAKRKLT